MSKSSPIRALAERLIETETWPEKILWSRLRHKGIGYTFMRQEPLFGFIVDFWCLKAKVVVELDGGVHDRPERMEHDKQRDDVLSRNDIEVLRFQNSDVYRGMSAVLLRIWEACDRRAPMRMKLFPTLTTSNRFAETLEMKNLTAFQEAKRLEAHEKRFVLGYRKKRQLAVGIAHKPWIKGGSL